MSFPQPASRRLPVSLVLALAAAAAGAFGGGCSGPGPVPPSDVYGPTPYHPAPLPQPLPLPAPLPTPPPPQLTPSPVSHARIQLGIDVLAAQNFSILQGKRVGLLTHKAGVNAAGVSTIEVLRHAPGVKLVALYAPEHGLNGIEVAGSATTPKLQRDPQTGLPLYELYLTPQGDFRKASPDMLADIDVMVVDLQDLGTRSYTFISCLLCTMEACFEQNKTVVVLDRPNPLGGLKVGGPIIDFPWMTYEGAFRIPYVHGLTIGELAYIAKENPGILPNPAMIENLVYRKMFTVAPEVWRKGKLVVIAMGGWRRSMTWEDTGLTWIPTSPKIPTPEAAFGYGLTGLASAGDVGHFGLGVGAPGDAPYPFRLLNYSPHIPPDQLAAALNSLKLRGLAFRPIAFGARNEKSGVYVDITNWNDVEPTRLAFELMKLDVAWSPKDKNPYKNVADRTFNILVGTDTWLSELKIRGPNANVDGFFKLWNEQDATYQQWTRKWWLYQP